MVRKSRCWPIAVALTLSLIISACSGDDDDGEAKRSDATATAERTQTAISDTDVDEGAKRTAINWARLIAASPQTCNDHMGQTACEQIKCQRVGGTPIPNCRPISRLGGTFRTATVQNIAIGRLSGRHALRPPDGPDATYRDGRVADRQARRRVSSVAARRAAPKRQNRQRGQTSRRSLAATRAGKWLPVGRERVQRGAGAVLPRGELGVAPSPRAHDRDPGLEGVIGEEAPVWRPGHVLGVEGESPPTDAPQTLAVRADHVELALPDEGDLGAVRRPVGCEPVLAREPATARAVRVDQRQPPSQQPPEGLRITSDVDDPVPRRPRGRGPAGGRQPARGVSPEVVDVEVGSVSPSAMPVKTNRLPSGAQAGAPSFVVCCGSRRKLSPAPSRIAICAPASTRRNSPVGEYAGSSYEVAQAASWGTSSILRSSGG